MSASRSTLMTLAWTLLLSGLAGGLIFWGMMHLDLRERINPTPARVSKAMVQGAWLNVVPQEDARVALQMGQCMRTKGEDETDKQVMERTLQCEWIFNLYSGNHSLAERAIARRKALTRPIWGEDPEVDLKPILLTKSDVAKMWDALAEGKDDKKVVRFLTTCLETMHAYGVFREENLWQRATLCEYSASWIEDYLGSGAVQGLVARRGLATSPSWPPNPLLNTHISLRAQTPTRQIAKALDRKNAEFLRGEVIAAWADTTRDDEKQVAEDLSYCLSNFNGKLSTGVRSCEERGMMADASKAMDLTIERRVKRVHIIAAPEPRVAVAPPSPKTMPAAPDLTAPAAPPVVAPSPADDRSRVVEAWNNTINEGEKSAANRLTACLSGFSGDLPTGVMICELRGMSADTSAAMDRTIARRAAATPHIKSPGTRAGSLSIAPQPSSAQATAGSKPADAAGAHFAIDVQGASNIVDQWRQKAGPEGADTVNRMEDCLRKTPVIVADTRGLQMAAATCKLKVQVEIENQAKALENLR